MDLSEKEKDLLKAVLFVNGYYERTRWIGCIDDWYERAETLESLRKKGVVRLKKIKTFKDADGEEYHMFDLFLAKGVKADDVVKAVGTTWDDIAEQNKKWRECV